MTKLALPPARSSAHGSIWPWSLRAEAQPEPYDAVRRWPKITVVTPSFNQAQFLEATLLSVLRQDYPNLEYIVMDGGSTDSSAEIIEHYAEHLAYWRSVPDGGQAHALAEGFGRATGEILCWINSDDILLPGALWHVSRLFAAAPKLDFVYGNRLLIDKDGAVAGRHIWPYVLTRWHWAEGQPMGQEACFWRRDLYEAAGGVDPHKTYIMDYDLFFRMWRQGRFRKTSRFLGAARVHDATKTATLEHVWRQELAEAVQSYRLQKAGPIAKRIKNRLDDWPKRLETVWGRGHRPIYP